MGLRENFKIPWWVWLLGVPCALIALLVALNLFYRWAEPPTDPRMSDAAKAAHSLVSLVVGLPLVLVSPAVGFALPPLIYYLLQNTDLGQAILLWFLTPPRFEQRLRDAGREAEPERGDLEQAMLTFDAEENRIRARLSPLLQNLFGSDYGLSRPSRRAAATDVFGQIAERIRAEQDQKTTAAHVALVAEANKLSDQLLALHRKREDWKKREGGRDELLNIQLAAEQAEATARQHDAEARSAESALKQKEAEKKLDEKPAEPAPAVPKKPEPRGERLYRRWQEIEEQKRKNIERDPEHEDDYNRVAEDERMKAMEEIQ